MTSILMANFKEFNAALPVKTEMYKPRICELFKRQLELISSVLSKFPNESFRKDGKSIHLNKPPINCL